MHLRKRVPRTRRPLARVDCVPFPRFGDFPLEIRVMIWSHAVESRVVHLYQERLKVEPSLYCQVRSDDLPPEPFDMSRRVNVIWLPQALEKRMALALGRYGETMDLWLRNNDGWESNDRKHFDGEGVKRYMQRSFAMGIDGPSYYTVRFQDGIAEVQWEEKSENLPEVPKGFKRTSPVPALLLACRESHTVVSPLYERIFPTLGCPAEIYFSARHDVLYMDESTFISDDSWIDCIKDLSRRDLRSIKSISFSPPDPSLYDGVEYLLGNILGIFGNVKQLTLVSFPVGPLLDSIKAPAGDLILKDRSEFELQRIEPQPGYLFVNPAGRISRRRLERRRLKWKKSLRWRREELGIPSLGPWSMPIIDYKLLLTPQIEQDLKDLCDSSAAQTTISDDADPSIDIHQTESYPSSSETPTNMYYDESYLSSSEVSVDENDEIDETDE